MLTTEAPPRPGSSGRLQVWRVEGEHAATRSDTRRHRRAARGAPGGWRATSDAGGHHAHAGRRFRAGGGLSLRRGRAGRAARAAAHHVLRRPGGRSRAAVQHRQRRAARGASCPSWRRWSATSSRPARAACAARRAWTRSASAAARSARARRWLTPALVPRCPTGCARRSRSSSRPAACTRRRCFDLRGELLAVREDVGRHNAVDKLMGWAFLQGKLPLADHIVLVSGRSSYEIMQKCLAAGVGVRVLGLGAEQPGGGAGPGVRHHPGRLPARRPLQRLRGTRALRRACAGLSRPSGGHALSPRRTRASGQARRGR